MDERAVVLIIMLVLVVIMLSGFRITGFVISESCCMGDDCSEENKCDFSPTPQPNYNILMYMLVIGFTAFMINKFIHR